MNTELKRITCFRWFFVLLLLSLFYSPAFAQETAVLSGKIVDVEGRAVEGARVFVYGTPDVRRSADFISAPTEKDGSFRLLITPGRYWAMARLKKIEGYGPLMAGDKHSGEAEAIELEAGQELSTSFRIADLKEARMLRSGDREGPVKLSGRILDGKGSPVAKAYVIANRTDKITGMPDYLSAWTEQNGRYVLYIPRGIYYVGAAKDFPPDRSTDLKGPVSIEADKSGLDIAQPPNSR